MLSAATMPIQRAVMCWRRQKPERRHPICEGKLGEKLRYPAARRRRPLSARGGQKPTVAWNMDRSMSSCDTLRLRWGTDGLSAHEDLDDGHRRTTTWTDEGGLNEAARRVGVREGRIDVELLNAQQF